MDFDAFLKQLQRWTNNIPLLILGSGCSIPYGIPGMWELGEYIKTNCKFSEPKEKDEFEKFKEVFDKTNDLELALSDLNLSENVTREIVGNTWEFINSKDLDAYEDIISISIKFELLELIQHLLSSASRKLSIITTNYDRLAEYAASLANAFICTGYSQNPIGSFSNDIHKNSLHSLRGFSGQVNIWKVHGSLDWFKNKEDKNIQLPLRKSIPNDHIPLIVTPGLTKYFATHQEPYRTIFTEADTEVEGARGFLCIGYGFNDLHVQPKLTDQLKKGKPIIVVTKSLSKKTIETIVDNECQNYILIEEDKDDQEDTHIITSHFGEQVITGQKYWQLGEFIKLIK